MDKKKAEESCRSPGATISNLCSNNSMASVRRRTCWRLPAFHIHQDSATQEGALPVTQYFVDRHAHFVADTHKNGHPDPEKVAKFITDLQSGFQQRIQIGW